jgi:hypothetical protein
MPWIANQTLIRHKHYTSSGSGHGPPSHELGALIDLRIAGVSRPSN